MNWNGYTDLYQRRVERMTQHSAPIKAVAINTALANVSEDSSLQLPIDFYRISATTVALAAFALPDSIKGLRDYRILAAAWCILLSRHIPDSSSPNRELKILLSYRSQKSNSFQTRWASFPAGETVRGNEIMIALQLLLEATVTDDRTSPIAPPANGNRGALTLEAAQPDSPEAAISLLSELAAPPDINLVITNTESEPFHAVIIYDSRLFLESTIKRFAGHLGRLGEQLLAAPDCSIADLDLLTPEEHTWINEISRGPELTTPALNLHQEFEFQVEQNPSAIGLRYRDFNLSYLEINQRANQLAHYLIETGVSAEQPVIVCLEPSFDPVIALLATWKAGGIYVPLDPGYPTARVQAIIQETHPLLIITRREHARKHGLETSAVLALDEATDLLDSRPIENPGTHTSPQNTASIYFTSGTTGRPKGVMASHANLVHYINVARERYGVTSDDTFPAVARFDFSISMFELMLPLTAGGTLILLDRDHIMNFSLLSKTLEEITFFHIGPSLLKGIIAHIKQNQPDVSVYSKVRHASSGGDMIPPEILESLKEIFSKAEIFVIYGCSEISCMGCTFPVSRTETVTKTYVGRPFQNVIVKILDNRRRQLPVGISGEICFAGGGVVKGYLNLAELSSEKFVTIDGQRFYCTGDIGRLSNDGLIEILGRRDFQIQLRGMRVELGEIEYALRQAPGVRDGIVLARATSEGEKQLIAYIVPKDDEISPPKRNIAIRQFMTDHVPDYMVPSTYTELPALPLNHNMKVNRRALQELDVPLLPAPSDGLRIPESATEKSFAELWTSLLKVDDVGLDNNFFELGGDSLLALSFICLVQQQSGVTLKGMDVLRESLEVLARICDHHTGRIAATRASPAAPHPPEIRELFYFGPDKSLFGVLTTPAIIRENQAVLICCASGHEFIRSTFIIQNLTKHIIRLGFPVLRFDYFGCRDALGDSKDATCSRWQQDIDTAHQELRNRTGIENIIAVGIRFGATLLLNSSLVRDFSRIVLWDPIVHGEAYYQELIMLHRNYLRAQPHFRWISPRFSPFRDRDLLGMHYSEKMIREFHSIHIDPASCAKMLISCLLTTNVMLEERVRKSILNHPLHQIVQFSSDCSWRDPVVLEEILPDNGISKTITTLIKGEA